MDSEELFNWPDRDVILRATHGTESRDFQVHKLFLSFASPVFKDMFGLPQPPSATSNVHIIDMVDPPAINDLTLLSEVLALADKYDIRVARSRLRSPLVEFAKIEPLRVYAIACRFGFEDEMKIASSLTTSIHLPGLTELPEEFKSIPATEYHRLILLHAKYRKEFEAISHSTVRPTTPRRPGFGGFAEMINDSYARANVEDVVKGGIPLNYESFKLAWKAKYGADADGSDVQAIFLSILDKANSLNLSV